MIISIDVEKAFDNTQHAFMIKTFNKVGTEGMYFNVIKTIYNKTTGSITLTSEKLKTFPLRSGTIKNAHFYSTMYCSPSHSNKNPPPKKPFKLERKI